MALKMDLKMVKDLCQPALLYFVLACIALVWGIFNRCCNLALIAKALWVIIWTWFLNKLCKNGYSGISWFLVVMPFLLAFTMIAVSVEAKQRQYIY